MQLALSLFLSLLVLTSANVLNRESIRASAAALAPWLSTIRRDFHRQPELMFDVHKTSAMIRNILDDLKIAYEYPIATTGVVATIGSGSPVVALRADMDALPIEELVESDYKSQVHGKMHACGHDSHMTMLLGAARILKQHESQLQGTVKLVFQPAEEGGAGGDVMVQQGALDGVNAAFGFHVWPALPTGTIATKRGTIMAGAKQFRIFVHGKGGHAAMPHLDIDPIVAASHVVSALQSLVAREISPLASGVISVTRFHAGEAFNIIPETAELGGTIRALTDSDMKLLMQRLQDVAVSIGAAHRCDVVVDWMESEQPYYPPTVNDASLSDFVASVARRLVASKPEDVREAETSMAGEDFSFMANKVPAVYTFLGIRNESLGSVWPLHSPHFLIDEDVMPVGVAMHVALAVEYFATHVGERDSEL